ncbi:MAG: PepSY domain-containing protein [Betaproteobacteria bacterium]
MKKTLIAMAVLAFSLPALAQNPELKQKVEGCTIKAWKTSTTASLNKMAKVTKANAEKTAMDKLTHADKKVTESKLESEDGCLVYSIDVIAGGDKTEFMIDAGDGKILRQRNATILSTTGTKLKEAVIPHKK